MSTVLDLHGPDLDGAPPLLARMVDDAALFGSDPRPMPDAVAEHRAARQARHAGVVGFLLCPVSRLTELMAELRRVPEQPPLPVSLVVDTGLGELPKAIATAGDNPGLLSVRVVEVPASSDVEPGWLVQLTEFVPDEVVCVVEPRRGHPDWLDGVRRVAEAGCWPKLRCGGQSPEAFPSVDEVTGFLDVARAAGRSFKATAGLHYPVRHHDEATGLTHHGLLNVLLGAAWAVHEPADGDVAAALRCTDPDRLAGELAGLDDPAARAVRELFASFGAAPVTEPMADLERLGLL